MDTTGLNAFQLFFASICGIMALSLFCAGLLFLVSVRKLKRIDIPPNASFMETLALTPFTVVLFIDLLDLGLDFLAAPIAWIILDGLGLKALRGVSLAEALIPGTQMIPTLTLCWLWAKIAGVEVAEQSFKKLPRNNVDAS